MAETQGQERTERPTAKRFSEARERGQVAKSQDLTAAVSLLCAMVALWLLGRQFVAKLIVTMRVYLGDWEPVLRGEDWATLGRPALRLLGETVAPLLLLVMAASLAVLYLQVGWLFTLKPLAPKFNKLNPLAGLRRLVGLTSLVKLGMNALKTAVVLAVALMTINADLDGIVGSIGLHDAGVLGWGASLVFRLAIRVCLVLLVLAILDYAYHKWKHIEDLKMTKQEVKEEMRQMEGDPQVRRRQRAVQMQLALQRIKSAVPRADVVITNPTHLAIAIRYDAETMSAPKVVAKGQGYVAERIRQIALEHGIPIVERKPLAQALFKAVEVGQEIPPQFYKAIAEILAYVYELTGRRRRVAAAVS